MVLPYLSAAEGLSRFLVDCLDSLGMFKGNEAERNEGRRVGGELGFFYPKIRISGRGRVRLGK